MTRASRIDSYPLSPMQQGMLFHHLTARQPGVDFQQIVCALHERVELEAFRRAWQQVLDRHDALRTSFRWDRLDHPVQEVHGAVTLPFDVQDWRDVPAGLQQQRFDAWLEAERAQELDLSSAPLIRVTLIQLAAAEFRCVWSFPHPLLDGPSLPIVLRDVFAYYDAACRGEELHLAPPRPYREYIAWLDARDTSHDESFWRALLAGIASPTAIAMAHPSGAGRGEQQRRLSAALTTSLRELADLHELTIDTLVLGAWAVLMCRYSGAEDVLFGAVRAPRRSTVPGADAMVGMFTNTLPVRAQVAAATPLLPWLHELRQQQLSVREFEHTPLANVQQWSGLPAGTALFESIVVFDRHRSTPSCAPAVDAGPSARSS